MTNSYCFCFIVLNAGTYLDFSLASIMNLVELNPKSGIVIVESADQFSHPLEKTKEGLSIDGTGAIIEKWCRRYPDRIVYYKLGNIGDKRESRNKCLELARNHFEVQYIFNVDGDELIKPKDFLKLDSLIANHPNILCFWLRQYLFWGDFSQKYTDPFAGYKEIVYANTHNLSYSWWHTQVSLANSPSVVRYMPQSVLNVDIPYYHYGYICNDKRLWMRRLYSNYQLQWFSENVEDTHLWNKDKDIWESFFKGEPFEDKHWADVEKFDLEDHPEEIKQHPWFMLDKKSIWESKKVHPTFELEAKNV